ncbi:MAG: ATP-binding protein, partial [Kiritimatiellae bacterium]|nr:ATP-binding protein [Kiritimatiellia bacterium]
DGKGLQLAFEGVADVPHFVKGDAGKVRQVLINLLGNAVKFTARGGITLRVQAKARDATSALVSFAVADTGIGIEPSDQERIFHAFEQADNSSTREYGGTGLGLAISQSLVNLMGSRIEVSSTPGQGSSFAFAIRLELPQPAAENLAKKKARVLVAENDQRSRDFICRILGQADIDFDLAADGGKAVDLALVNRYDLILTDQRMPVMDGIEATLSIRQIPHHADTPIVALTADAYAGTREKCLQAGINDCISKPLDPGQLQAKLRQWLGEVHASPPASSDRIKPRG